jgi:uncharacterized membrane protein
LALRAQLALTLTQILMWVSLIGGVAVALLWLRRRTSPPSSQLPRRPHRSLTAAAVTDSTTMLFTDLSHR